jgi:molybdopterin/thiamine biosynthesis adenylyltransferase
MLPTSPEVLYEKTTCMPPIAQKTVLVVGAGGLGGPALLVVAASGVGRIVLVEDGAVERSSLHREPLFGDDEVGARKADAAARRLSRLFPAVTVEALDARFGPENAAELLGRADVVVECAGNFATKFLANDSAVAAGRPLVHGAVLRYTAQVLTVMPGVSACLRCLFEEPPPPGAVPSTAEVGVLGALAGFAGSLLGAEAVRLLLGERGAHVGRLLVYEARSARARAVPLRRREGCSACGALRPPGEAAQA